jgi:hypothetical protein
MPAYLHDFNQVLRFELTGSMRDQDSELTHAVILPDAEQKEKCAGKRELAAQVSVDNISKAAALLEKTKLFLPITARPTKDLVNALKEQGIHLDRYRDVQIKDVYYMGDEGGITCDITPPGREKTPVFCSLTHLLIQPEHPLFEEIRAYQGA